MPQVDVGRVGQDSGVLLNFRPQEVGVGGIVAQVERASVDGVQLDAVAGGDVGRPKGSVVVAVAPDARHEGVVLVGPEVALVLVKPVLFDGALFGGVEVDSEVAQRVVARH